MLAALKRAGVNPEDVSAMVADNAANQKRAGDLAVFDSLGCVAHTLQLTAKRCMETPRSARALRNWRKVCSSFRHSGLKLEDLYKWQVESGLKALKPIQDLPTRWYYSYLSTNYALENKVPLKMAFAKYGDPNPPLPAQRAVTRQSSGACAGQKEALTAKASEEFFFTSDEDCSSSDDGSVLQLGDDELATESPAAPAAKQTAASTLKPIDVSGDDPNEGLSSGSELEYGSTAAGTHNKRKKAAKKKGTSPICSVLLPRCCCQSITTHCICELLLHIVLQAKARNLTPPPRRASLPTLALLLLSLARGRRRSRQCVLSSRRSVGKSKLSVLRSRTSTCGC